jgi:hypothetical protein
MGDEAQGSPRRSYVRCQRASIAVKSGSGVMPLML